jgi:hypothetical protein
VNAKHIGQTATEKRQNVDESTRRRSSPTPTIQERQLPMTYQPGDDEPSDHQKEEKKRAKADREQLKKDRDAQRAKLRKDRAVPKDPA